MATGHETDHLYKAVKPCQLLLRKTVPTRLSVLGILHEDKRNSAHQVFLGVNFTEFGRMYDLHICILYG